MRRQAPSPPRGQKGSLEPSTKPVAGQAAGPLPGPAAQEAPILPGGQWRPGFGRESSGRPGRHPPLEGCRLARGPGGLPGRSLSLSLGRESEARTPGATEVIYLSENPAGQKKGLRAPARPGCRAPREARRFTELPTALPGGERRLGAVHETSGGPSRSPPAQPVALEGSRALPGQSLATFF